ncbi:MAG: DUF1553 domain-containing protein [Acidobacteria bacterium]|nr:DUF1553 domain-containing protein [Acidobacteriota bacterium]
MPIPRQPQIRYTLLAFSGLLLCGAGIEAAEGTPATVEFNRDIRPILSDKCFTCHGPDPANRKTALRFDTEAGARIDLGKGRFAIVPADPGKSEMFRRISSDNKAVRMPPAYLGHDKLSDREIELIRRWIEQGARWQAHWSFLPPKRPPLPEVRDPSWPRNPIDYFILARLEQEGLHPSPEADRTTLIRRVTLDLTGLPPTPAEVDAFLNDSSPQAYEKVVDRLLASPSYAERMAVRWLEAARYGDTNGYQTDGERDMWRWRDWVIDALHRNMPFDQFTIEQIAGDLLPNATLSQKIATGFHRNHRTSGEGGIVPEEFRVEYVADRVETTATVWLGLTLGCARCHDHKYDPIKQKDFYRVFAYFNNVPEKGLVFNFGNEEPYVKAPTEEQQSRLQELSHKVAEAEKKYAALQPKLARAQAAWERRMRKARHLDWSVSDGLILYYPLDGLPEEKIGGCEEVEGGQSGGDCRLPVEAGRIGRARRFDGQRFVEAGDVANFNFQDAFTLAAWISPSSPNGAIVSRTEDYFEGEGYGLYLIDGKVRLHIIRRWTDIGLRVETESPIELNRWQHVMATYDGHMKASGVSIYVDGKPQKLRVLFDELNYPLGAKDPFRIGAGGGPKYRYRGLIDDVRVYNIALSPEQAAVVPVLESVSEIAALPPAARSKPQADKLAFCFVDRFAPSDIRQARQELLERKKERQRFFDSIPTVMVMQESETPRDTFVLKRGAYDNPGQKVTPGVPSFLPPLREGWPNNRLGLARWLVDPSNPLTARVIVNRFWQMYFGGGLVKTVEDFGSQGEWPIHPELLDWLATEFVESGWNVKAMQKTIVMSTAYRQSSKVTPELLQKDPENRLLARGPRFRLPAEMIRDQALAVSGLLVEKVGGPPVKPYQPPGLWQELAGGKGYEPDHGEGLYRRSLYTYWRRTVAPPAMITFDAPNRETCVVRETRTNTPLQALDLMNDVTYVEASRRLAERMIKEGGRSPGERITYACRLVLARPPKPAESKVLLDVFDRFQANYRSDRQAAIQFLNQGESPRSKKLDSSELAAYASVASLILNLDEAVTKE